MKPLMLIGAVSLHLSIAIIMGLVWFSLTMLSVDVIFLDDPSYVAFAQRLSAVHAALGALVERRLTRIRAIPRVQEQQLLVLYDDTCPVCTRSMNLWKRLDLLHLLEFQSLWTIPLGGEPVTREQLQARIHSRKHTDKTYANGCDCLVQIMCRVPPLIPIAGVLWLLSKVGIGQSTYDMIAKRRYMLPVGHCTPEICMSSTTATSSDKQPTNRVAVKQAD